MTTRMRLVTRLTAFDLPRLGALLPRGVERQQLRWVAAGATLAAGPALVLPWKPSGWLPRTPSPSRCCWRSR